jgi:DNA-binding transcriptional regulator GbsR (MarR family)
MGVTRSRATAAVKALIGANIIRRRPLKGKRTDYEWVPEAEWSPSRS